MTDQLDVRSLGKRRRTALRVFYGFVVAAIAAFTSWSAHKRFARRTDGNRDSPRGRRALELSSLPSSRRRTSETHQP